MLLDGGVFVARTGSSSVQFRRAVQRSSSMHHRMKQMVIKAKQRAVKERRR